MRGASWLAAAWLVLALALAPATGAEAKEDPAPGSEPVSCVYETAEGMTAFDGCAWTDRAGRPRLAPEHLRAMRFGPDGLAPLFIGEHWAYADRTGRMAPVVTWDNGADPFRGGLARSPVEGRTGYIDRRLRLVIPARYDGAYPFEDGHAVVCVGCVAKRDPSGEHSWYEGGRWGCIDRRGREIVPLSEGAIARSALAAAGCVRAAAAGR
jgi:hypothetical protein